MGLILTKNIIAVTVVLNFVTTAERSGRITGVSNGMSVVFLRVPIN